MRILVTGCLGFLGSIAAKKLLEQGHQVIGVDKKHDYMKKEKIEKLAGKRFHHFYYLDVASPAYRTMNLREVDAILHFASYISVEESIESPLEYYENNLNATINVCKLASQNGIPNIIYSSSATVYDTKKVSLGYFKEDSPTNCINPYGWTKLMSEQILSDYAKSNPNNSILIFRYFNPVGSDESHELGDETQSHLFPSIMRYIENNIPIKVYGKDYNTVDGTCCRDYIHVLDLIEFHILGLSYLGKFKGVDIMNLGTGKYSSVLDVINMMSNVLGGGELQIEIEGRRPGDAAILFASNGKAYKELDYKAERTLENMCNDVIEYQRRKVFYE